ncbi:hypothetical protein OUZ56_012387 [Daphnia magna]|uniref:Secreted protein n=1 Tax=Daphnia magna TaxID=35525 RepID=A0ABQ9Z2U8_9CRUS|nr:hypothetical protein OUZ56_012387 [Daphnia magna]
MSVVAVSWFCSAWNVPGCTGDGLLAPAPYTGSTGVNDTFLFDGVLIDVGQEGGHWCWMYVVVVGHS